MNFFTSLISTALYSILIQNLVFGGGFGLSESIRISSKPARFRACAIIISGFSLVTSLLCLLLEQFSVFSSLPSALSSAVYSLVLLVVYIVVGLASRYIFKMSGQFMKILSFAALNTLVLAIPAVNHRAAYSLAGCIGSGLGAGIAFVLAGALISKGALFISDNNDIPQPFKGAPALFIYVGLISLAFAGFTGKSIFG